MVFIGISLIASNVECLFHGACLPTIYLLEVSYQPLSTLKKLGCLLSYWLFKNLFPF